MTRLRVGLAPSLIISAILCLFSDCQGQEITVYEFPGALERASGGTVIRRPGQGLEFMADPVLRSVRIVSHSQRADGTWSVAETTEPVTFYPTCACSDYKDTIYLVGTNPVGKTLIKRWVVQVVTDLQGQAALSITKSNILNPTDSLTHINSVATPPSEEFLALRRYETGDVLRLDLSTGTITTLLDSQQVLNLHTYTSIHWAEHVTDGDAVILEASYDYRVEAPTPASPKGIVLWYADLAAGPALTEFLTIQQWEDREYEDIELWAPNRYHFGSRWGEPFPPPEDD